MIEYHMTLSDYMIRYSFSTRLNINEFRSALKELAKYFTIRYLPVSDYTYLYIVGHGILLHALVDPGFYEERIDVVMERIKVRNKQESADIVRKYEELAKEINEAKSINAKLELINKYFGYSTYKEIVWGYWDRRDIISNIVVNPIYYIDDYSHVMTIKMRICATYSSIRIEGTICLTLDVKSPNIDTFNKFFILVNRLKIRSIARDLIRPM